MMRQNHNTLIVQFHPINTKKYPITLSIKILFKYKSQCQLLSHTSLRKIQCSDTLERIMKNEPRSTAKATQQSISSSYCQKKL